MILSSSTFHYVQYMVFITKRAICECLLGYTLMNLNAMKTFNFVQVTRVNKLIGNNDIILQSIDSIYKGLLPFYLRTISWPNCVSVMQHFRDIIIHCVSNVHVCWIFRDWLWYGMISEGHSALLAVILFFCRPHMTLFSTFAINIVMYFWGIAKQQTWRLNVAYKIHFASSPSLIVHCMRLSTIGNRAFPVAAARVWNTLLQHVTSVPSLSVYCSCLKTRLYIYLLTYSLGTTNLDCVCHN